LLYLALFPFFLFSITAFLASIFLTRFANTRIFRRLNMRLITSVLLLCSSILPAVLAQDQNSDAAVAASFVQQGGCAYYFKKQGKESVLTQTCQKYCENHGGHGYSECDLGAFSDIDIENPDEYEQSFIRKDEDGDVWVGATCKCENKAVEEVFEQVIEVVVEGLEKLDKIICAVMLESFKTIAEIGIEFIPGGAELNGARRAVEGAKSFAENGLEAADFFGNWVSTFPPSRSSS
jgi:hypothetical protein